MPDFGRFAHVWINPIGSILPMRCQWCSRRAEYTLTREDLNGNTYVDEVCNEHANEWDGFREGTQLELEMDE